MHYTKTSKSMAMKKLKVELVEFAVGLPMQTSKCQGTVNMQNGETWWRRPAGSYLMNSLTGSGPCSASGPCCSPPCSQWKESRAFWFCEARKQSSCREIGRRDEHLVWWLQLGTPPISCIGVSGFESWLLYNWYNIVSLLGFCYSCGRPDLNY